MAVGFGSPNGVGAEGWGVMKRLRSAGFVGVLTVLGFCLAATPGVAQPIERNHFQTSFSLVNKHFCGDVRIRLAFDGHGTFLLNSHGPDGLAYAVETFHGTESYTNLATNRTLTVIYNVFSKDLRVTDNGDGTLTVIAMATGSVKVYGPGGKLLFNDPGQIRLKQLIDDSGTPGDPTDDEFLADLGVVKGSTGRNDMQGRDFCADIHEFLG